MIAGLLEPHEHLVDGCAVAEKVRAFQQASRRVVRRNPITAADVVDSFFLTSEQDEDATDAGASAAGVSGDESGGGVGSADVADDALSPMPARSRKRSVVDTAAPLVSPQARASFHVNPEDSVYKQLAKLQLVEDELTALAKMPEVLKHIWDIADGNGNGTMSCAEWTKYARENFNALADKRATKKAFAEAATATSLDGLGTAADLSDTQASTGKETMAGQSMPTLNRSNFLLFLNRTIDYNKCHYAFVHLDTTGDDAVDFNEYTKHRGVVFKVLGVHPELAGGSVQDEFHSLCKYKNGGGGGASRVDRILEAGRTADENAHGWRTNSDSKIERVITFNSFTSWYRRAMDGEFRAHLAFVQGSREFHEDSTGVLVDIDVFCDMVIQCHYRNRNCGVGNG